MQYLSDKGIQTRPVWYLNHLQKPYKSYQNYKVEKAIELWENTLNIPCSIVLNEYEVNYVLKKLTRK